MKDSRRKLIEDLLPSAQVQVNVRIPVRLRVRMEEFLQYLERPLPERVPESEYWPTSMQGLVQAAIEDYLAHHPLKERTGPANAKKPKPTPKRKAPEPPTQHPYRSAQPIKEV